MLTNRYALWSVVLLGMLFSACGYMFTGSGNFPADIRSIYVTILENRTSETGMENTFTNDLIYEFTKNDKAALANSKDKADAILAGVIESLRIETISHRGTLTSIERRVQVSISLRLTDQTGKIIWFREGIVANETYNVVSDKLGTEQNRRTAIADLSKRLAEKIYNGLTDDF